MVVIKQGRSMGEVVFIDQGEMDKAPAAVREAFGKESGPIPHVALSDASATKVYGTSNHSALKGGLDSALKLAKRAMREDMKNGTAPKATETAAKPASAGDSAAAPLADIKITEKSGVKDVTGAPLEAWTNSKGTSITARLTRTSGVKVTLVTDQGKTVTLNQADLAPDSFTRLQEILSSK